ncbi:MAG: DNA-processing protein DprA [Rhodospirillales bacterium]
MGEQHPERLSDAERLNRLRLIRSENVGPITFHRLMQRFASAAEALDALPDLARKGGRAAKLKVAPKSLAEAECERLAALGGHLVCLGEAAYPPLLAHLDDAPPVLAVLGHLHLLTKRAVAVVGARNASANGKAFARSLARDLGAGGLLVVSGLARGIDAAAHQGALESGTLGVVAGGVDVTYPKENAALYEALGEAGAILSEVPPGTEPQARHFPRRNRIISGIARGVVVVEASPKSGSLITARLALEQGREVFAVPGPPGDPRTKGCNDLIRAGALLTENADDVLDALKDAFRKPLAEPGGDYRRGGPMAETGEADLDRARSLVAENLSPAPTAVDDLIRETGLAAPLCLVVLLELELAGRVEHLPGNRVALRSHDGRN